MLSCRFDHEEQIRLLLLDHVAIDKLQIRRVFKSGWIREKNKDKIDGFIRNCTKNVLHLAKGKTIRVTAKDDPDLQKHFYDIFVAMNKEEKTDCKFDYDEYDVTFWIKSYNTESLSRFYKKQGMPNTANAVKKDGKLWIITSVEGLPVA